MPGAFSRATVARIFSTPRCSISTLVARLLLIVIIVAISRRKPAQAAAAGGGQQQTYEGPARGKLTVLQGPLAGNVFPLIDDVTTIGSMKGNTIIIEDQSVSRRHAAIKIDQMRYEVADMNSTNGVLVNGGKISAPVVIGNGKAIALGEPEGLVKTIFDAKTGELLGAHMIGAEVTELIQGYSVAKTLETTEAELMATVFPHPTLSEMMHESVLAAYGRTLHI